MRKGSRIGNRVVQFSFDGKRMSALQGDTAASALLANGVRCIGRSVKFRRPRGVMTAGPEEPNALLSVGTGRYAIPNVPAPLLPITDGLELRSQNCWPDPRFDLASLPGLAGGLFGAGFYYKTFMWPSWRFHEGIIRRLAGLGRAPRGAEAVTPWSEHFDADVLVVGAGPAGLAAALAAARRGARVIVCERDAACGGELDFETATIDGRAAPEWVETMLKTLAGSGGRVLTGSALVGRAGEVYIAQHLRSGSPGSEGIRYIRARALILAIGAIELPIAFVGNDLPGVMLLGAAERYLARYGVRSGESAIVFGNHDRLYASATRLAAGGIGVRAVVDVRDDVASDVGRRQREALQHAGVECMLGHAVRAAHGRLAVREASIVKLHGIMRERRIACDAVLVSGGWSHSGIDGIGSSVLAGRMEPCGAGRGRLELQATLADGFEAGLRAAHYCGARREPGKAPIAQGDAPAHVVQFWRSPATLKEEKQQFVDFQNDVTVADLRQSLDEGFRHIEHVKRYTALGVGTEQGRTGNWLGAGIVAELSGQPSSAVRVSRRRPPLEPVAISALCGARVGEALRPARRTPLHDWHASNGGVLEEMGMWLRPRHYTANGANVSEAGRVEAARVREHGGIVDLSTLGKIEIAGPDAAAFLEYLCLNRVSALVPGRSRYVVYLREDGMVMDDGMALRLAKDRFLATVSTAHAGHMLAHFEYHARRSRMGFAVSITDVTDAWAVIAVAGPRSRATLQVLLGESWRRPLAGLVHLGLACGRWHGQELRVLRAGFSGELAFELHCQPDRAMSLWTSLSASGLAPYGLEALDVLRIEKGYLTGAEMNGQTTPDDLGMGRLIKHDARSIGVAMLDRPAFSRADRPRLVGLHAAGSAVLLAGAQLTAENAPASSLGHVTSAAFSPVLGKWIGLGMLARNCAAVGTKVLARDPLRHGDVRVRVVPPIHFDPEGKRMKAGE